MSKVQDIIALSQAGFTKNEISVILGGAVPEPDPVQIPTPKPDPALAPKQETEPVHEWGPRSSDNAELIEKMDQMLKYVHSMAIRQSEQPPQLSADDVVATILGAPGKE